MKTVIVCSSVLFFGLVTPSQAQSSTIVSGKKLVPGKDVIVAQPPVTPLPGAPLVGGSDTCTTPDTIVGSGPFAFDNTLASSGPQNQSEPICLDYNTTGINADVWFKWTAGFNGNAQVSLCGGTTMDSRLAVYAGTTCPAAGSALACNDDFCGLTSQANFLCTSGNSYVIQLGTYPGVPGQTGTFTITQITPPAGDDCGAPIVLPGPGTYNFDCTLATTSYQGQAETLCLPTNSTQIPQDLWYAYTAGVTGSVTVSTCGLTGGSLSQDTRLAAYSGTSCPALGTAIACNDDDATCVVALNSTISFAVACGQSFLVQIGRYPNNTMPVSGQFSVVEAGTSCVSGGVGYCFGDGSSTACPCGNSGATGNGCASSVNANGGNLAASGSSMITNDTLVLGGSGMPNSSCLYFQGTTQISPAFGDGLRCAGGSVIRLSTKTNVGGSSHYPAGADAPVHVKGAVSSAGTRTYQTWYRNAAAFCTPSTFNLTNGVLVTWQ